MIFSQIVCQERAKKFLRNVMIRAKMPHAYLFTGIPGIGKTSMALALAAALNCRSPVDRDACGHCRICRMIKGGNFPDFLSITPDGERIGIDQIRDLNRSLGFAPLTGRYRVCVVYGAETMTDEAANAFLKTLEEPPPGNIIILNATEPLDLLPTIVSRCQRVAFQPLPTDAVAQWLKANTAVDKEAAKVLSSICGGSLGRAIDMAQAGFLERRGKWFSWLMGIPSLPQEGLLDMAAECAGEDKKKGLEGSKDGPAGLRDMLAVWETWYRDLLVLCVGGPEHLLINVDFSHKLKNMARGIKVNHLADSLMALDAAQRDLRKNRNTLLVMEHCILNLSRLCQ